MMLFQEILVLKDQVEAMKWVQKNIETFNGDARRVMILGGTSVHLHYMSSLTDDLFNNGFSHSGTALSQWALVQHPREKVHRVATFVNCSYESSVVLLDCLRKISPDELAVVAKHFQPFLYNPITPSVQSLSHLVMERFSKHIRVFCWQKEK